MKNNKGFTIIELLVVIAIIGVLASIVLVNVTRYIDRGKDAAAKGDMATLFTNAITYYNTHSEFDGIKTDEDYANVVAGLNATKMGYTVTDTCDEDGGSCLSGGSQAWCASILEKGDDTTYFCVDSTGAKKESITAICADGVCPD